jgi:TPP-dependent pyruvate/acetoin dehydrogenase alpha subunit
LRGDPVPRFRGMLVQSGVLTAAKADELAARIATEMQEAVSFALDSPFPKPESALEYNYA